MDNNLLLAILGELKLAAISPLATHEITASGTTYVIYRRRQIGVVDGYVVMKIVAVTATAETTTIKTAFLPWLEGISVYDVENYNAALIAELGALTWG